jgi:DNA-binding PadR family transcriptional regulator
MTRITWHTLVVLSVLMEAPEGELYGLQVCRRTEMESGAVYPILRRSEQAGWVTSWREDIDPRVAERPARRYYRLTPEGSAALEAAAARLPKFLTQKG